ncbi:MAG TPA: hypothetical protein VFF68_14185, partial [Anaerolineaceae bacterium]|nr:hypothetical protein [Anaerolineaceae bacterium]
NPPASRAMILTAGLSDLGSYQVSYKKSVQGMLDGAPYESSTTIVRSLVTAQPGEEATVDSLGPEGIRVYLHYVRMGDERYYQSAPDQPCKGSLHSVSVGLIGHPAALLPAVTDPQPAGSEVINGIETIRYPLNTDVLGLAPEAGTVTGSLWIAEPGGYLVKYSLNYQPAAAAGNGLEAEQTIEYEISRVNEIEQIDLPAACMPILTDIPAMPNATRVERRSGLMSYYSAATRPEVAAFYTEALPALGWQPDPAEEGDPDAGLSYSKDGSLLNILLEPDEEGLLLVSVLLSDPAQLTLLPPADIEDFELPEGDAGLAAEAPTEAPIDPLLLGLPPDVPLYPGATQVQSMSGMGVSFSTSDSVDQVAQFYSDVFTQAGWQSSPIPAQAGGMMIWMKGNGLLNLSIQAVDDGTTRVSIMVVGG